MSLRTRIVFVFIVGIVAVTAVVPAIDVHKENQKAAGIVKLIDILQEACQWYHFDVGSFPLEHFDVHHSRFLAHNLTMDSGSLSWNGPYIERKALQDPWGRVYQYAYPGTHGVDYDLFSLGKSEDKDDDNVINWTEKKEEE